MNKTLVELLEVVNGGFCVGCGVCAFISDTPMKTNEYGEYEPFLNLIENSSTDEEKEKIEYICPSLNPLKNETVMAKKLYGEDSKYEKEIGYYKQSYAGFVQEKDFQEKGTSGGIGTWVAVELLKLGLIDGVIHVKENKRSNFSDPFYKYGISTNEEEIRLASKTRYHVVEMKEILELVQQSEKRFLFIGVPCMCKTIRRLQLIDSGFQEKIPFVFSLVCGHLKSINWSLSLAWGAGVLPQKASKIQYRTKGKKIPARSYIFSVKNTDNETIQKDSAEVAGGKFNAGALMLPACEFCDDVIGETADLTIGDAWLPRFDINDRGTNLLVVRNEIIDKILIKAKNQERIKLEIISANEVLASQAGGYRQKREGLAYRLDREKNKNKWVPKKRINPNEYTINKKRKIIYDKRTEITFISRKLFIEALQKNNFLIYEKELNRLTKKLRRMEILNILPQILQTKTYRFLLKLKKRLKI